MTLDAPSPPESSVVVRLRPDEARAALKALSWALTRRPDAFLQVDAAALLAAQRKLADALPTG